MKLAGKDDRLQEGSIDFVTQRMLLLGISSGQGTYVLRTPYSNPEAFWKCRSRVSNATIETIGSFLPRGDESKHYVKSATKRASTSTATRRSSL